MRVRDPSFAVITAAGFAATIGQVLLLRELLALFSGNEMSVGLTLAGWLLWTALGSALAARRVDRAGGDRGALATLLALLAAALPALVLLVRAARQLFGIPAGELAPIGSMVLVCLGVPAAFGLLGGALFGLCWAGRRAGEAPGGATRPLHVYLGEALGAAGGGLVFYFLLLPLSSALGAALVVSALLLTVSGWTLASGRDAPGGWRMSRTWWLVTAAALVLAAFRGPIEIRSRQWQWGEQVATVRDTPYQLLAVLRRDNEVSVFSNGLWLFTRPDPASAEPAVHLPLLEHPEPRRVLLLGGGVAGHLEEALRHPGVERVDYVELDPELIALGEGLPDQGVRDALRDPRVRIHRQDAGTFLRRQPGEYDVILLEVGDPINAQMNRFYTLEQFRRIRQRLRDDGVFSFSVAGGGDVIGPAHARFLGSLQRTLARVFPRVVVLPGERARFLAAGPEGALTVDPSRLAERLRARGLEVAYLREDILWELMNPIRLEYARALLAGLEESPLNRQLEPICYFHVLMLWAAQWHPALERLLAAAAALGPLHLTVLLALAGLAATLFFWLGRPRYRGAVGASVVVQGAWGIVLQLVLILGFQVLEGFAYRQLALIIACFMAGLALGTLLVAAGGDRWRSGPRAQRSFALLQAGVSLYPLLLLIFFSPPAEGVRQGLSSLGASWIYSAASLAAGILGGAHFALAALALVADGARVERTGGYLYALDLAGAAGGAFAAGLFVLPVFGVLRTLILLAAASLVCLVAVLRRP